MARSTEQNPGGLGQIYAQGWYFRFRSQNIGPISLQELTGRYSAGELKPSDLAWHPAAEKWMPMREILRVMGESDAGNNNAIDGEIVRRLRRADNLVARNATYLIVTAMCGLVLLLAANTLIGNNEGDFFGVLLLLVALTLFWWAWLEYCGVRFSAGKIVYPARLSFWPKIFPYHMARLDLADVTEATFTSLGKQSHLIDLNTGTKSIRLLFDSLFVRDSVLAILSIRSIKIGKGRNDTI